MIQKDLRELHALPARKTLGLEQGGCDPYPDFGVSFTPNVVKKIDA